MVRAVLVGISLWIFVVQAGLSDTAFAQPECPIHFTDLTLTPNQTYARELQGLSPADEMRIRTVIESLEANGVSREKILAELRRGGVCGR